MLKIKQNIWEIWVNISFIWLLTTIICGIAGAGGVIMWINVAVCIGNLLFCLYVGERGKIISVDHSDHMYIVEDEEDYDHKYRDN